MNTLNRKLTDLRRSFHRDPEVGFNEVRTKARVAQQLRALDIEVQDGTGVVGVMRSGGGNRIIGLRADMGARAMIDEGLLQQFPLDEVYAIHNLPGAPLGEVSTRVGKICASESLFEIEITGQGGMHPCHMSVSMQSLLASK